MMKDTDEQPDEEIHRMRSGEVPSTRVFVSVELGGFTLLECGCVYPSGSSSHLIVLGFYGGFLTQAYAITESSSSSLCLENRDGNENSKF